MNDDKVWTDELTSLERRVYRIIAYAALAVVFLCIVMVRNKSGNLVTINCIGFLALFVGMIFGYGHNKSVRVLDLRRYEKK